MKIIVIGSGASGLTAAIKAKSNNNEVIILEKNNKVGKKILVTGNGKCNYYNDDFSKLHYHSTNKEIISNLINDTNQKKITTYFNELGLIPYIKDGYYYPHSNQAITVLNALTKKITDLNIKVYTNTKVINITKENKFIIKTNNGEFIADKVIVATGSYAYYKDEINSYNLLKKLNHKIIKPLPALVQLKTNNSICKKWAGVRVKGAIKLIIDNNEIREEKGELMLTSYGVSGICAMQLSGEIAKNIDKNKKVYLIINFIEDIATTKEELKKYLDNYNKNKDYKVNEILDNLLNYKLGNCLCDSISDLYYNNLSNKELDKLLSNLIEFKIEITATNSFKEAQTCTGGIPLEEINPQTMESLKVKDLYITGEVLDITGDCGGYNLAFAWLSGLLAGSDAKND